MTGANALELLLPIPIEDLDIKDNCFQTTSHNPFPAGTNLIQLDLTIRRSKDENGNKIDPLYKTFR